MIKAVSRAAAILGATTLAMAAIAIAQPAQAADCRYDKWGSSQWKGQKYTCPDGTSMYIKPPSYSGNSWDSSPRNSWEKWGGTDNYGNRYNCTWDTWRNAWKCS